MTTDPRDAAVRRLVIELVDRAPEAPPFPTAGVTVAERVRTRAWRPRSWAVAILAAVVVVGAVVAVVVVRRSPAPHPAATPAAPAVAFVDGRGLVVRSPAGEEKVVAPGAVSAPRWSASGDWLAYRDDREIWVVRSDGTEPILLGKATDIYAWSPTVDALAVTDGAAVQVSTFAGATATTVAIRPSVGGVQPSVESVAWSRGGTSLAIAMERRDTAGPGAPVDSLWLAQGVCLPTPPAQCSQPRELKQIPYTPGPEDYPLIATSFGFDNADVLFWADAGGSSSIRMDGLPLKAVSIDGGTATTIATTIVRDSWVAPSPDGSKLLVVKSDGRMVTDPRELLLCTAPDACRAIAPAADVQTLDPAWSPDGNRIAFVREDHASYTPPVENDTIDWTQKYRNRTLWIANTDGSDAHEVPAAGLGVADPQFAPDGQSIVFVRDARVWQLDLATNQVVPLSGTLRVGASCTFDDCLPDVAPYEAIYLWSDHYAVKFSASAS